VVWLACDTRSARVGAVCGEDTVTSDRQAVVTVGALQPAHTEALVLRELLIVIANDSVEADAEADEFGT